MGKDWTLEYVARDAPRSRRGRGSAPSGPGPGLDLEVDEGALGELQVRYCRPAMSLGRVPGLHANISLMSPCARNRPPRPAARAGPFNGQDFGVARTVRVACYPPSNRASSPLRARRVRWLGRRTRQRSDCPEEALGCPIDVTSDASGTFRANRHTSERRASGRPGCPAMLDDRVR
jgi:hypothetical protein